MKKLVLFAGTTEGRELLGWLDGKAQVAACVATEYGKEVLPGRLGAEVLEGRLDARGMERLLSEWRPCCVVDATHPYAVQASQTIREACQKTGVPCLRLLREESGAPPGGAVVCESAEKAAAYAAARPGNVLLTTGSKELAVFTKESSLQERLFARVLPLPDILKTCLELGVPAGRICAMQGPFSREMNAALLRQWNISVLVTKDSGKVGGYLEKLQAAEETGVQAVVIGRPKEKGYGMEELKELLRREYL